MKLAGSGAETGTHTGNGMKMDFWIIQSAASPQKVFNCLQDVTESGKGKTKVVKKERQGGCRYFHCGTHTCLWTDKVGIFT